MKILIVTHEYPPIGGGGANACMHLSKAYAEHGHQVTIVTANYNNQPEEETTFGIKILRVNSKRKAKDHCSFKEMLSFVCKAWKITSLEVKKEMNAGHPYDICQIFFGIPSGPIGLWLKWKYGLPYFIRFGGGDIPGFQERFQKVYGIIGPALKIIWKNAEALVANSEGLREFAYAFENKYPIEIIPNGVDTNIYVPADCLSTGDVEHNNKTVTILFVSRLIERKGLQFIIPEFRKISEKVLAKTGKEIKLLIVGDGPYREALERLAKDNNSIEFIEFAGHQGKDTILSYYQRGDLFILPSKREGMPNVVLEAMACGLPILMTPCEGSKELIDGNGYVITTEDFSYYIEKLSINSELRFQLGERSRNLAVQKFSWEQTANDYMKLMEKVIINSK